MLSQDWHWGYSDQPPLYAWLVRSLFAVTGPHLVALIGLKVVLLSSFAGLLIAIGKQFSFSLRQLLITLASVAFVPQFIWESQRDLTHSVLATVLAAATLLQLVRTQRRPTAWNYLGMGLLAGLGLLSKYNYSLFLFAVTAAAIATPSYKRVLLNPRIGITLACLAALFAPHAFWISENFHVAAGSAYKLKAATGFYLPGLGRALMRAAAFLSPLWFFSLLLFTDGVHVRNAEQEKDGRFLTNLLWVTLTLVCLFVLTSGARDLKGRWFQPLLFFMPLLLALRGSTSQKRVKAYCGLSVCAALTAAAILPSRTVFAEALHYTSRPNIPYPALFAELASLTDGPAALLAENNLIGGNARPYFERSRIMTPKYEGVPCRPPGLSLVLCEQKGLTSEKFRAWLLRQGIQRDALTFSKLEAPCNYLPRCSQALYWAKVDGEAAKR